jgi:hypothetical protein
MGHTTTRQKCPRSVCYFFLLVVKTARGYEKKAGIAPKSKRGIAHKHISNTSMTYHHKYAPDLSYVRPWPVSPKVGHYVRGVPNPNCLPKEGQHRPFTLHTMFQSRNGNKFAPKGSPSSALGRINGEKAHWPIAPQDGLSHSREMRPAPTGRVPQSLCHAWPQRAASAHSARHGPSAGSRPANLFGPREINQKRRPAGLIL